MPQLENAVAWPYICIYSRVRRRVLPVFIELTDVSHGRKVNSAGYGCPSDVKLPKTCNLNERVCCKKNMSNMGCIVRFQAIGRFYGHLIDGKIWS